MCPERTVKTKFYTVSQNNSGGYFEINKNDGIACYVCVEAMDSESAKNRLHEIVSDYSSYCSCCGERWYENFDENDGFEVPQYYSEPLSEVVKDEDYNYCAAIHYLDGTIEWLGREDKE